MDPLFRLYPINGICPIFPGGRCGFLTAPIDWNPVNLVLDLIVIRI